MKRMYNIYFMMGAILLGSLLSFPMLSALTTTYLPNQTDQTAYYGKDSQNPTSPVLSGWTVGPTAELSTAEDDISLSDNTWNGVALVDGLNEYNIQMVMFKITESVGDINNITYTWEGWNSAVFELPSANDLYFYIYNFTSGSWGSSRNSGCLNDACGTSGTEASLTYTLTSGISDYVNASGNVLFLIQELDTNFACPVVYSWNGTEFVLDNIAIPYLNNSEKEALVLSNLTNLKIKDGKATIQLRELLNETSNLDELYLLVEDEFLFFPLVTKLYPQKAAINGKEVNVADIKISDDKYLITRTGDTLELYFEGIPPSFPFSSRKIALGVEGYFIPDENQTRHNTLWTDLMKITIDYNTPDSDANPIGTLTSPINTANSTSNSISLVCNFTDDWEVKNISIYSNVSSAWELIKTVYPEAPNKRVDDSNNGLNMSGNFLLYHFNNDSYYTDNTTKVFDYSGSGNNGSVSGFDGDEIVDGYYGKSFDLITNDYVTTNSLLTGTSNGSIMAWLNFDGFVSTNDYAIVANYNGGAFSAGEFLFYLNNDQDLEFLSTTSTTQANYTIYGGANAWHHVAVTWGANNVVVYIDGTARGTDTSFSDSPFGFGGSNVLIGRDADAAASPNPNRDFDGEMDEVILFNRTLSATEILNFYNGTKLDYYTNFTLDSLADKANYVWNCLGVDNSSQSAWASNGNFSFLVAVPPVVTFIDPTPNNEIFDDLNHTSLYNFSSSFEGNQMKVLTSTADDGWFGCDPEDGTVSWGAGGVGSSQNIDTSSEPIIDCMGTVTDTSTSAALDSIDFSRLSRTIDDPIDNGGGMIFIANPDERDSYLTGVNWTIVSRSGNADDLYIRLLLWNVTSSTWYQCANHASGSDTTRYCSIEDPLNFLNSSGNIHLGFFGDFVTDPGVDNSIDIDYAALNIYYTFPSPDTVTINISCDKSCLPTLTWNGTNESMTQISTTNWYKTKSSLPNGNYTFKVYANNTIYNESMGVTENRWVYINLTVPPEEVPIVTTIYPTTNDTTQENFIKAICNISSNSSILRNISLYTNSSGSLGVKYTVNQSSIDNGTSYRLYETNLSDGDYEFFCGACNDAGCTNSTVVMSRDINWFGSYTTIDGKWIFREGSLNDEGLAYCRLHNNSVITPGGGTGQAGNGHDTGCVWRDDSWGNGSYFNSSTLADDTYCSIWTQFHFDEEGNYTTGQNVSRMYCHIWGTAENNVSNNNLYGFRTNDYYGLPTVSGNYPGELEPYYDNRSTASGTTPVGYAGNYHLFIYDNETFNRMILGEELYNLTFYFTRGASGGTVPQVLSFANQKSFCYIWTNVTESTNSSLNVTDTDGDGLTDWQEMFVTYTDLNDSNTDDDFYNDLVEYNLGLKAYNPYDDEYTSIYYVNGTNSSGYYTTERHLTTPSKYAYTSTLTTSFSSEYDNLDGMFTIPFTKTATTNDTHKYLLTQTNYNLNISEDISKVTAVNVYVTSTWGYLGGSQPDPWNLSIELKNGTQDYSFWGTQNGYRWLYAQRLLGDFDNFIENNQTIRLRQYQIANASGTPGVTQAHDFFQVTVTKRPDPTIIAPTQNSPISVTYPQNITLEINYVNTSLNLVNITIGGALCTLDSVGSVYQGSNVWYQNCSIPNLGGGTHNITAFINTSETGVVQDYELAAVIYGSCSYSGSGNWVIECSDSCNIVTDTDLGGNALIINGTGKTYIDARFTNIKYILKDKKCLLIKSRTNPWVW